MIVSAIVAVGKNLEIGNNNDLLWHLPADMKHFKESTINHHIITGRRSYDSIPEKYRPLPNRVNIVVSRQQNYQAKGAITAFSILEAIKIAKAANETEVFIIGGGQIYKEAIQQGLITKLYITWVDGVFDADTFFPKINLTEWKTLLEQQYLKNERNSYNMTFSVYEKK